MARKILIVDDEPDLVTILKFTLETHGFSVVTAYDGEEGFRKAQEEKPDLIILDVLMPKIFGDDIGHQLRKEPATQSTPILFLTNVPVNYLTGSNQSEFELQKDTHGNLYLLKTCSEEQFLNAINQLLPLSDS